MEIKIDKEFADLCRKLTAEEENLLESQLCDEGCRDALVLWAGHDILLDGHNRKRLCERNGLAYSTTEVVLGNREQAIEWIITNQLGKRNVTEEEKAYLRGKRRKHEKAKPGGDRKSKRHSDVLIGDVDERLAKEYGVSPKTIERDEQFADAVDAVGEVAPEAKASILSGQSKATRKEIQEVAALPVEERKEAVKSLGSKPAKEEPTPIDDEMAADVLYDDLCAVIEKHKQKWKFSREPFVDACFKAAAFSKGLWRTKR